MLTAKAISRWIVGLDWRERACIAAGDDHGRAGLAESRSSSGCWADRDRVAERIGFEIGIEPPYQTAHALLDDAV